MSSINGVHALLAILIQQTQSSNQLGGIKTNGKQLEQLIQEARLLNERLLKIEKLVSPSKIARAENENANLIAVVKAEGSWPAADVVRDLINRQERLQAFGSWQTEEAQNAELDAFTHRVIESEDRKVSPDHPQLLIQKYIPTDIDLEAAEVSANYGVHRSAWEHSNMMGEKFRSSDIHESRSRLMMIAVGIAILLLTLFAGLSGV
jgi:hypothetical protein